MDQQPISFPNWKDSLARAAIDPSHKAAYAREIITFLHQCKVSRSPATVGLAKKYLALREDTMADQPRSTNPGPARAALRWFFSVGSRATAVGGVGPETSDASGAPGIAAAGDSAFHRNPPQPLRAPQPPPAATDLGSSDWEGT